MKLEQSGCVRPFAVDSKYITTLGLHSPRATKTQRLSSAEIAEIMSILSQNQNIPDCVEGWDSVKCVFRILEPQCPIKC